MALQEDNAYDIDHVFNLASLHSLDGVFFEPARADLHSRMTGLPYDQ